MSQVQQRAVWVVVFCVSMAVGAAGCVSKGKYTKLEKDRDQLADQVTTLQSEKDDLSLGLAAAVAENKSITFLSLGGNKIGDKGGSLPAPLEPVSGTQQR